MTDNDIAASIADDEKYFRRRGLPTLIEDYSATGDILTRAWPWLTVLFIMQVLRSIATSWAPGLRTVIFVTSVVTVGVVWALVNRRLGRPLFAPPERLGWWSAALFVVIPSIMRADADRWVIQVLKHAGFNVLVCALVVGIIGWGLVQTVGWAIVHLITEFGRQLLIVFRQMAAIFLFCFLLFFNQEIWQFAAISDGDRFAFLQWTLTSLALLMLLAGTPRLTRYLEQDLLDDGEALTWAQRINLTSLFAIRQFLQLSLIFVASYFVFAIISMAVVSRQLMSAWQIQSPVLDSLTIGGQTFILTEAALRMSILLALAATLNFSVVSLTSQEGRENFLEGIEDEVDDIFERRRYYQARRVQLGLGEPDAKSAALTPTDRA
ncbi:MAG: hypothetical protein Q3979_00420 [Actinomycetaceae bacterium]|nr:hypothetical protein [Actinomycetaceae bacterium]